MYLITALPGVRPVGLATSSSENSHQITPENPIAMLIHTLVQIAASLVLITCAFLLNTPRSRARKSRMKRMKMIQTAIGQFIIIGCFRRDKDNSYEASQG